MDGALARPLSHVRNPAGRGVTRMATDLSPKVADGARLRHANLRTALAVTLIAVLFFVGVIAAQFVGNSAVGMSVVAAGVLLFLVFAIGRHLRK